MAELVAGAFLSSSLQVAFDRLASRDILDYFRGRKLKDGLLKKLRIILISINQVIQDAEERQYKNPNVKQWLDELKDEVYKAEDLLDEIATEASRQKLDAELHTATRKVRGFFTAFVHQNLFDREIESRIIEVLDSLEYLTKQNEILGLKESPGAGTQVGVSRKALKRLPTTSFIDESNMYGRDDDAEKIVEILLSHNLGGNQLPVDVIAIVGMGGMGKTTLARLVYEDKRMKDQFQHRAWVCISEEFDVVQATKLILQVLDGDTKKAEALDSETKKPDDLKLKEQLMGKKFFLVLDDVWSEDRSKWQVFQNPLKYGAPGSKILITTRNKMVAEVMRSTYTHLLKPLKYDDCWMLFAKHALNDQHHSADPNFESIGRKIVDKCGGLPLAIKTLGSLLYTKLSPRDWIKILESDIWHLSEDDSNIIPSLRLSYHYLPSNLKRCFAYCSIFPKDYVIKKDVLIQLWMAEGLLHSSRTSESIEEVGNEIFNDLESRIFFEPSKDGGGDYFIMHDLLNDLAKSVMGEFCLRLEGDQVQNIPTNTRYFSYLGNDHEKFKNFKDIFTCHQLRNFFQMNKDLINLDIKADMLSRLARLKYMRVLSLRGNQGVKRLTNDIGDLKHLRYLDLSFTEIEKLPDSMCLMINLQTLKLNYCSFLTRLPSEFYKLINLRHLELEVSGIKKMPKHMGKLKHLQTMTQFVVGKNRGSDLKELGALNHLKGTLVISDLNNVTDPMNARGTKLKEKHLEKLKLYWEWNEHREMSQNQEHILEAFEPDYNVKELTVERYVGTRFPSWLGGSHLPNLVSLYLSNCTYCINLPPLGQLPFLERLDIKVFEGIKVIGQEFFGNGSSSAAFRALSYLTFWQMEEWNICCEGDSFPCLQELSIWNCPKLTKSLPQHLPSLRKLNIRRCKNLAASLPKASTMEELCLESCRKISLKDMPTWSLTDVLPPLHDLTLIDCPEMESLPQGGWLSNLHRLSIKNCHKLIASRKDWGLHELLSLEELEVGDDFEDVESFPEEGLLPPNVHSLSFQRCLNLKTINYRGLLHLHSLRSLSFFNCPRLSLEAMPEEGLPRSLSHLQIGFHCPLLKQRCQRETGQDWPKISHIPHVQIDEY